MRDVGHILKWNVYVCYAYISIYCFLPILEIYKSSHRKLKETGSHNKLWSIEFCKRFFFHSSLSVHIYLTPRVSFLWRTHLFGAKMWLEVNNTIKTLTLKVAEKWLLETHKTAWRVGYENCLNWQSWEQFEIAVKGVSVREQTFIA